tara:strand:+ start:227 stop:811 length:585 start_codon:yes stop_codon:yes gene_type:complete
MINKQLEKYNIILGSASERRKNLLKSIGLKFDVMICNEDELYNQSIEKNKIAEFLAEKKSMCIEKKLKKNYLLITADTIVYHQGYILHKPNDKQEAIKTLQKISGNTHHVITGVCIKSNSKKVIFSCKTEVYFNTLSDESINFYLEKYAPYDKAGSYGIQEWIGMIGIKKIIGSYNNVVGLPTAQLYQNLKSFI